MITENQSRQNRVEQMKRKLEIAEGRDESLAKGRDESQVAFSDDIHYHSIGNSLKQLAVAVMSRGLTEITADVVSEGKATLHLENQIAQLQSTPSLSSSKGEGEEMTQQIKDRVPVGVTPDGKNMTVWVTGKDRATFYRNVGKTLIEHGLLEELGIQTVKPDKAEQETKKQEVKPSLQTFKEYVERWFEGKKQTISINSQKGYESVFNAHLFPYFGSMPLNEITWLTVQNFLNARKESKKETLRDYLKKLRVVLASAMEDGIITSNPAKNRNIKNPGKVTEKREALTEEEREKIAKALPAMEEMDAQYVAICLYAATRKSETLGMQWKHITVKEIQVRQQCQVNNKSVILPPKSDCGVRDIPIQDRLKPYLANRGNDDDYLFGTGMKPPTKYMFEKMWKRIESHLHGIGFTSHVLRHTFITECAEKDVPVNVTQQIAGHSTPGITLGTYTHVTEKMKQNAMRKLNSL